MHVHRGVTAHSTGWDGWSGALWRCLCYELAGAASSAAMLLGWGLLHCWRRSPDMELAPQVLHFG